MMASILKKPLVTEKLTEDGEKYNRFGFVVDKRANKLEIKSAVEKTYGVTVESVNTMNYGGGKPKMKYTTRGIAHQRNKAYKKAIITLTEGDTIDLYGNI